MTTTTISVGASLTFSYSRFTTVSSTLTFSYRIFETVFRTLTCIYNGPYLINCGYCASYPGSPDCLFVAFHMLESHELDLIKAPIISHNQIPAYYTLEQRANCITELMERRKIAAGWLAIRK
jgi:hypothetical protein